jgi:dihydroorotate dehydrogenase (fumarate)
MKTTSINTKFLGLDIPSPIISGSCGIASKVSNLVALEKAGAGAVILKSLFEEQIICDIERTTGYISHSQYGESYDYVSHHVAGFETEKHFNLIKDAKKSLSIPVIGSINCVSFNNWIVYAQRMQDAGCDALELNFMILPCNVETSAEDIERLFNETIFALKRSISIPILIKVGKYFTDMSKFMHKLSWCGINGITMFSKNIDFDIDTKEEKLTNTSFLTPPQSLYETLRWTSLLSAKLRCEISASSGIYTGDDVVKALLAGAQTTQVVSTLYENGLERITEMNNYLKNWMEEKEYSSIEDFRGKMAVKKGDSSSFVRTQFMKYFAEIQ